MTASIVTTALTRSKAALTSPCGIAGGLGVATGCYALTIFHQYTATFGSTLPFFASALVASGLGWELGQRISRRQRATSDDFIWFTGAIVLLTSWVIAFPGLASLVVASAGWFDVRTMSVPWVTASFAGATALVLLTLPMLCIARVTALVSGMDGQRTSDNPVVADRPDGAESPEIPIGIFARIWTATRRWACHLWNPQHAGRWYVVGAIGGLMFAALLAAPYIGVQATSWLAAALSAAPVVGYWWSVRSKRVTAVDNGASAEFQAESSSIPADASEQWATTLCRIVVVVALGAAFAVVTRMIRQLMPGMAYIVCAEWAALMSGILLARIWIEQPKDGRAIQRTTPLLTVGLTSGAWIVCVLAAFPWLIGLMLELNSTVSQVPLLQSARMLTVWSLVFPLGLAWGAVWRSTVVQDGPRDDISTSEFQGNAATFGGSFAMLSPAALAFVVGFLVCRALMIPQIGLSATCLAVACSLTLAGITSAIWNGHSRRIAHTEWLARVRSGTRLGRAGLAACLVLVVVSPTWRGNYDPAKSARLLFSSTVSAARSLGFQGQSLQVLDDGRLVAVTETSRSTYTLWKHHGAQLQLREDGIPKAVGSTDPRIFPHYTAELMPTVLPLVLHESPHRVLLLGLRSGLPLVTTLDFPVIHVSCAESDSQLKQLVENVVWPASERPPVEDDRLEWLNCTPTFALTCHDIPYDVIISSPDQAAFPHAAPCYTVEFYRRAARRLSENGIFCQRFGCIDFGPEPVRIAASTMSDAFEYVAVIESAPGELVLLGTNSTEGLVRDGLVERCQAPQVRYALSQLGWDWVVPLNLSAYGGDKLAEFIGETSASPNTARNGSFAFTLPQEVMRWGAKQQEVYERLAHHSQSLLLWGATDAKDPDVLKRLAEVTAQRRLMADSADEYWAYRRIVRKQVTERPRSVIKQVSGEAPKQVLHPEERRRMRYFEKLGDALKAAEPDPAQIQEVAGFAQPYDPLISFFLHDEVAQLYARLDGGAAAAELVHRLHSVYFADPADRSVRNVIATINLLVQHPEATADSQTRWDHVNALLQVLKGRWETRAGSPPAKAHVALVDVDRSAEAVENAFAMLDELSGEVEDGKVHWPARRAYLERTLMRPLRTYRGRLLPHHLRERNSRGEDADSSDGRETAQTGDGTL